MYITMLGMGRTWVTKDVYNHAWNGSYLGFQGCILPCLKWVTPGLPRMYITMLGIGQTWVTEDVNHYAWNGSHLGYQGYI